MFFFFSSGTQILPRQVYERDPFSSSSDSFWPGITVKRYFMDRKIIFVFRVVAAGYYASTDGIEGPKLAFLYGRQLATR